MRNTWLGVHSQESGLITRSEQIPDNLLFFGENPRIFYTIAGCRGNAWLQRSWSLEGGRTVWESRVTLGSQEACRLAQTCLRSRSAPAESLPDLRRWRPALHYYKSLPLTSLVRLRLSVSAHCLQSRFSQSFFDFVHAWSFKSRCCNVRWLIKDTDPDPQVSPSTFLLESLRADLL